MNIAELITKAREDGVSFDKMSARALNSGYAISNQYLSMLAKGKHTPSLGKMRAIAVAIDVPLDAVREAVARGNGTFVDRGQIDSRFFPLAYVVATLSRREQELWFALAAGMAESVRGA